MGRYISINLRIKTEQTNLEVLRPLFLGEVFTPMGIGGIGDSQNTGNNWLLAGYGLEYFLSRHSQSQPITPPHITVLTGKDQSQQNYLQHIADWIMCRKNPTREFSMYEQVIEEAQTTLLEAPSLDELVLKRAEGWLAANKRWFIEIVGTFSLTTTCPEQYAWKNAFRFLASEATDYVPIGIPFVSITVRSNPYISDSLDLLVFSESTIWLRGVTSLEGFVWQNEADENARKLGLLIESVKASGLYVLETGLSVEGSLFRREAERLTSIIKVA
jgi:hypothetical protein